MHTYTSNLQNVRVTYAHKDIYKYMNIPISIRTCICMHTHTWTISVRTCIYMYTHTLTTSIRTCICMYTHTLTTSIRTCICMYTRTRQAILTSKLQGRKTQTPYVWPCHRGDHPVRAEETANTPIQSSIRTDSA